MRHHLTLALFAGMSLGLGSLNCVQAQDEKKDEAAPGAAAAAAAPAQDPKPAEATATEAAAPAEKPIPPEVQAKIDAARRAVAEAIVAAQDAGLVDSTIEPPPILDILILGRADDRTKLKAITKELPEAGVSPEVFGAWFTGYGLLEGVKAEQNVRILHPSKGLKAYFDERNRIFSGLIAEVRKANGPAPAPVAAPAAVVPAPATDKPADAPEPARAEETKAEEPKPE